MVGERRGDGTKEIAGRVGSKVKRMIPRNKSRCSDNIQSDERKELPILRKTADTYVHIREKLLSSAKPGRSYDGTVVTRTVTEPKESGE